MELRIITVQVVNVATFVYINSMTYLISNDRYI
nr:MAG TPA: hypothetical protein [Caudoviricetes sp.]